MTTASSDVAKTVFHPVYGHNPPLAEAPVDPQPDVFGVVVGTDAPNTVADDDAPEPEVEEVAPVEDEHTETDPEAEEADESAIAE